jgi:hypothetical protein
MDSYLPEPTLGRRRRASFRRADLARALQAAQKAGQHVTSARINNDGSIDLAFAPPPGIPSRPETNPWDA